MAVSKTIAVFILAALNVYSTVAVSSSYNSETEICCNGTVLLKGDADSCCDQVAYEYGKYLCCQGLLVPVSGDDSHLMSCCENEATGISTAYNYKTEICCDGVAVEKPDSDKYYDCCNGELYSYDTQRCCGDKIIEQDGGQQCCGEEVYDNATQACCDTYNKEASEWEYDLIDVDGDLKECCGGVGYNPKASICCDDVVSPLPEGMEDSKASCCGVAPYDSDNQVCCTQWEKDAETERWSASDYLLLDVDGEKGACCGDQLYDYKTHVCCESEEDNTYSINPKPEGANEDTYYGCCGEDVYAYDTQLCVADKVEENPEGNFRECGGQVIDYKSQSCCHDTAFDDDGPWACCYGAKAVYNTESQTCCGEEVAELDDMDKSLGKDACCTVEYY